jgi:hypothetical protein
MPTVFGPTLIPDRSVWGSVAMVSVSFVTDRSAAEALLPHGVEIAGSRPVVTVSRMTYQDVDYLAGGGYNEVTVGIGAGVDTEDGVVRGSFMPVVWVDEQIPIQIGREFLGYAKVPGELPAVARDTGRASFELRERDTLLLAGQVSDLRPVSPERLAAVRAAASDVTVLGWKYIPSLSGAPDADYPTRISLQFAWDDVSVGAGELTFGAPTWAQAPVSSRIVATLARLPMLEAGRATVAVGRGEIDRTAARRLAVRGLVASHAQ